MIQLRPYPMMEDSEVEALFWVFEGRKPKKVLEWGSGGSTLYWPVLFPDIEWLSIEHNPQYARAVSEKIPRNAHLLELSYPEYYELAQTYFRTQFDLIVVDGRQRVRCLATARRLLADGGAVVLHDAGRARYAPARAFYRSVVELHPPKPGRDPRGLWLLTGPVANAGKPMPRRPHDH